MTSWPSATAVNTWLPVLTICGLAAPRAVKKQVARLDYLIVLAIADSV